VSEAAATAAPLFPQAFLNRLETLRVRARRRYLGMRKGSHLSPRRGTSLEFADFRVYVPGDDPRTVDWGIYGRTGRLYVRVYQEEEDLFVYLLVDASASMGYPAADRKYETASRLALALAYVALASDDSVRIHRLTEPAVAPTPFYRGRRRLLEAREFLDRRPPDGALDFRAAVARQLGALRHPGKAILISDCFHPPEDFAAGLALFVGAGLDLLVIHLLGATELTPPLVDAERLIDAERGGELEIRFDERARATYLDNLERHRREVRSLCHRAGVPYAFFDLRRGVQEFVLTELPALGLLG
jgi:uncharacterized protein (DUF58 family)